MTETTPQVVSEFTDYKSLVAGLRAARELRNVTYETVDNIGGLPRGMSSKILAPNGERKVTMQSLEWLLGALALKCQIVSDDDALRRINGRMVPRNMTVVRNRRPAPAWQTKWKWRHPNGSGR